MHYTVLVADDEQGNLETFYRYLSGEGSPYRILNAGNGQQAVAIAQKKMPDLVIMDWEMPVMDGIAAVKALKADESTYDIPVIMATGVMISPSHLETALGAGAVDFVRKPLDKTELLARMRSALALSLSYRKIKAQKAEIEDQKNRALASTTLHLLAKSEILTEITAKLEKLYQDTPIDERKALREVLHLIRGNMSLDRDWQDFQLHFESVHPGFFTRLQQHFTTLTPYDLRFSAYIRMNLATKEIARMLNITIKTVQSQRYRLKKKLGLPEDEDLIEFVNRF